jgi:hypothetical protein
MEQLNAAVVARSDRGRLRPVPFSRSRSPTHASDHTSVRLGTSAQGTLKQQPIVLTDYGAVEKAADEDILRRFVAPGRQDLTLSLGPIAALIAGILILIVPRLLNYIVALYQSSSD